MNIARKLLREMESYDKMTDKLAKLQSLEELLDMVQKDIYKFDNIICELITLIPDDQVQLGDKAHELMNKLHEARDSIEGRLGA